MSIYRIIRFSILMLTIAVAIPSKAQVSLGIEAGYTSSDLSLKGNYQEFANVGNTTKPLKGWHVDLQVNIPLIRQTLYLQPVLRYTTKGACLESSGILNPDIYTPVGQKLKLDYFDLPVNLVYRPKLGRAGRFFIGAGPYIGHGLSGKYSFQTQFKGEVTDKNSQDVVFTSKEGSSPMEVRLYPWDFGVNCLVGFEFRSLFTISANYSKGFQDIDRNSSTTTKNQYWGLSLGFFFSREDY